MIHYRLRCAQGHEFDSWFRSSDAFEKQARAGLVQCPVCGDTHVARGLMTPALARAPGVKGRPEAAPETPPVAAQPAPGKPVSGPIPAQVLALLQRLREEVERNSDYVGSDFAEEARRIHKGGARERAIHGEASDAETEALQEEGIAVSRIPWVPRSDA